MPERILRDWTDSVKFDGLAGSPEALFTRLLMKADDYGRFSRDPVNVRGACYPRAENLRANTVDAWLDELSGHRLILCYQVGGKPLLAIINFRQRLRIATGPKGESIHPKPKYPPPEGKHMEFRPDDSDWRAAEPGQGNYEDVVNGVTSPRSASEQPVEKMTPMKSQQNDSSRRVAAGRGGSPPYSNAVALADARTSASAETGAENKFDVLNGSFGGGGGMGESKVQSRRSKVEDVGNAGEGRGSSEKMLTLPTLGAVTARILRNDEEWSYDNCKVDITKLSAGSLKTALHEYAGQLTSEQAWACWLIAAHEAHGAVTDGMVSDSPEAYAVGVWKQKLRAAMTLRM